MAVEQPSVHWAIKQQRGGLLRERMLVIAHSTAVDLAKVVLPFHGAKKGIAHGRKDAPRFSGPTGSGNTYKVTGFAVTGSRYREKVVALHGLDRNRHAALLYCIDRVCIGLRLGLRPRSRASRPKI